MSKNIPINLINFNIGIGKVKPRTINGENQPCPFCQVEKLVNIVDTNEDMIFLRNKYNVLEPSEQFVIIEGNECHSDIPMYSKEKMFKLLSFGLYHWLSLLETGKYSTVLFFKNYGPMSGGTIHHPHMQIVALPEVDPDLMFSCDEFEGITVATENDVEINMATRPRIGFSEINILVKKSFLANQISEKQNFAVLDTLGHYIQSAIRMLKDVFNRGNFSYNIFFYILDGFIRIKILPRFATSPLYVGYNIHLKPNNISDMAQILKKYI